MKRPTQAQLELAATWLENNEGDELAELMVVANWLRQVAVDDMVRSAAREAGVPVAKLRRKMRAQNMAAVGS